MGAIVRSKPIDSEDNSEEKDENSLEFAGSLDRPESRGTDYTDASNATGNSGDSEQKKAGFFGNLFAKEVLLCAVYKAPFTIPVSPALHPEHFTVTPLDAR